MISQLGRTVFSSHSPFYVAVIFGTAAVLIMAANTSFQDFPRLAALHAGDGFLPRWMTDRDNRLVYGIGITVLSLTSGLLIVVFQADVSRLIPLYAIGVFLSFSISQTGMVVRWRKTAKLQPDERVPSYSPEGIVVTTLEHDRHSALALGVGLRAFVVFGTPAILGLLITFLLSRLARGLQAMRFLDYVSNYRTYLRTEVYARLRDPVLKGGTDLESFERAPVSRTACFLAIMPQRRWLCTAARSRRG